MKSSKNKWRFWLTLLLILSLIPAIAGCKFKIVQEENKREIPFVIVSDDCIPMELKNLIEQRKEEEIKITYVDGKDRYIIIGYGKQSTGGYSVYIKELYATDNAIYVDTSLLGPSSEKKPPKAPSYPVLVLQISEMGLPVVFQ